MKYTDLDSFTKAYIQTALWSSTGDDDEPMDRNYSETDIAPATLQDMAEDCVKFRQINSEIISAAVETGEVKSGPDFDEYGRAAHDFWLTRNGHGAGFWDGDWPEPFATQLTDAAKEFGTFDLYVGDDGLIYGM